MQDWSTRITTMKQISSPGKKQRNRFSSLQIIEMSEMTSKEAKRIMFKENMD